jgi:hypothetical protein
MAITMICSKDDAGARDVTNDWRHSYGGSNPEGFSLHVRTTHEGMVLKTGERNGYDDSDFYAVVWNPVKQCPEVIEYATTRAWTYANSAEVDATPEVLEAYRQFQIRDAVRVLTQDDVEASQEPAAGRLCRVIKGRKLPKGALVIVRRLEAPRKFSAYSPSVVEAFVADAENPQDPSKWVHTNVKNLAVINPEQYRTPAAEIEARAKSLIAQGVTVIPRSLVRIASALPRGVYGY